MIYTNINNTERIESLSNIIPSDVFDFLNGLDLKSYPDGRIDLSSGAFVQIQSYNTVTEEEISFESHKKYIDIQFMIDGIEYCDISIDHNLQIKKDYDETMDAAFYESPKLYSRIILNNGDMAILFPEDIHRPRITTERQTFVKKAVVKVLVDNITP